MAGCASSAYSSSVTTSHAAAQTTPKTRCGSTTRSCATPSSCYRRPRGRTSRARSASSSWRRRAASTAS
eukprot:scaffold35192_cov64-Phaeocystis_antarctica.AAC.11